LPHEGSALADLKAAAGVEAFGLLDRDEQFSLLYMLTRAALQRKDGGTAFSTVKQAIEIEGDLKDLWLMRVQAAVDVKDYDDAAATIGLLAKRWPGSLAGLSDGYLLSAPQKVSGKSKEALLQALYDAQWKPADQFRDMGEFWLPLVITLVDRGDLKQAAAVSHLIDNSGVLIEMRADKRFDAITRAEPDRFDIMKAIDARLAKLRKLSADRPDMLEGPNDIADLLITLDKPSEAAAMLEDVIAKSRSVNEAKPYFQDADGQLGRAFELDAQALELLGRRGDAIKAHQRGAAQIEQGKVNVSQTLDLALRFDNLGRPKDALEAIANFDPAHASPFGLMVWYEARSCAFAQLGDQDNLAKSLAYLKDHADDGQNSYKYALICANDTEAYAKALIADLEDPERRADALFDLQNFKTWPSHGPWAHERGERTERIMARADVKAEVAKVGRIETYPIYGR
jgi:hypothetical protein